jgi:hypothetical protein
MIVSLLVAPVGNDGLLGETTMGNSKNAPYHEFGLYLLSMTLWGVMPKMK